MKKMFVAFGIAIALTFGMIFGTANEAKATEITEDVKYEQRFEDMFYDYMDDQVELCEAETDMENIKFTIIGYHTEEDTNEVVAVIMATWTQNDMFKLDVAGIYVDAAYDMFVAMGY